VTSLLLSHTQVLGQCDGVVEQVLRGVRCVVFDVGESLVDETRVWQAIADECGVPVATVCGVLGGLIERREHHGRLWDVLGVERVVPHVVVERRDLYPDALPCIDSARRRGMKVGVAGNQPVGFDEALSAAGVRADFFGSSVAWAASKPSAEFFDKVIDVAHEPAEAILYVGDRLDNDIVPAHRAGMRTAHIRRGPWGYLHAARPERAVADMQIDSLADLTAAWRSLD
jgi:FMN phosphatase YigB (HAD superfamily)